MKLKTILLATALSAALAAPVYAVKHKPTEIPLIETDAPAKLDMDVKYVTGGVGDDERAEIEAAKSEYNVYILNAKKSGEYVEDTRTVISRKNGKTLEPVLDVLAGPLLYVELAPGSYVVEAIRYNITKKKDIVLNAKTKTRDVGFYWVPPVELAN